MHKDWTNNLTRWKDTVLYILEDNRLGLSKRQPTDDISQLTTRYMRE